MSVVDHLSYRIVATSQCLQCLGIVEIDLQLTDSTKTSKAKHSLLGAVSFIPTSIHLSCLPSFPHAHHYVPTLFLLKILCSVQSHICRNIIVTARMGIITKWLQTEAWPC